MSNVNQKEAREAFFAVIQAQMNHRSALREVWEWNDRLKDDTGGYRGMEDVRARDREREAREEYREAFDTYVALRFGLTKPDEVKGEEPAHEH